MALDQKTVALYKKKATFVDMEKGEKTEMEPWEFDFEWLRIRHYVKDAFQKESLPDLNAILFLIGIQELGYWEQNFTKEEKQDLMHIAVCRLLSIDGHFEFAGRDADGWPHWKAVTPVEVEGLKAQERLLKQKIIQYFDIPKEAPDPKEKIS